MALSKDFQRAHWQRAAQLILGGADADDLSRQVELALFYDRAAGVASFSYNASASSVPGHNQA